MSGGFIFDFLGYVLGYCLIYIDSMDLGIFFFFFGEFDECVCLRMFLKN